MNDFIELEKKLLHDNSISKHSLRTELERELGDEFNENGENNATKILKELIVLKIN